MNFKQRLFTLLLGLLFATVLTDQASALYDPGVGRFCTRDPNASEDETDAYYRSWPEGTYPTILSVHAVINRFRRPPRDHNGCGKTGFANWNFQLTPDPKTSNLTKPCKSGTYEGYLVQRVEGRCYAGSCRGDCACPSHHEQIKWRLDIPIQSLDSYTYFEYWEVTARGSVVGKTLDDFGFVQIIDDSCGFHDQKGDLQYFCKEDLDVSSWHKGNKGNPDNNKWYGTTENCRVTPGLLPSTEVMPDWDNPLKVKAKGILQHSGSARAVAAAWGCCGLQKDKWVFFDAVPR